MVTFRFYVVSLVAFFLALAVGVVVGSVLDDGISRSLQSRVERLEDNLDENVAVIDEKNRVIEEQEAFGVAVAPFAGQSRLDGTSVLVVAEPGVAQGPVEDLALRLRQAGGHVEGIVWLEQRWALESDEDLEAVATALAAEDEDDPAALRAAALSAVMAGVAATGEQFVDPTLVALEQTGVLRLVRLEGTDAPVGTELLVVSVTGTSSTAEEPGAAAIEVASAATTAGVPTVFAEIVGGDDERGALSSQAREAVPALMSTVDDLDLTAGRVATVLALADLRTGVVGHYGYGPDVDGVLPRWLGP